MYYHKFETKVLHTYQTIKVKKVGHWAKTVCKYITKNQKNPQSWGSGLLGLRGGFS